MREILFRGKNPDNNEWVEGSLVHRSLFYGDPANEYFILIGGEFHCDFYNAVAVNPATIGQYTGLADKNGVKVFEGDIAQTRHGRLCIVDWFESNSALCFDLRPIDIAENLLKKAPDKWDLWHEENLEVIGNIHDNPDLLTCCDKG